MAQYLTVARPYAKALFAEAKGDEASLLAWERVLKVLSLAVADQRFMQLMVDPRVSVSKRKALLSDTLLDTLASDVTQLGDKLRRFIDLLLEYQRLAAVPDVLTLYKSLLAEYQNTLAVKVVSAYELNESQQQQLVTALGKHFGCAVNVEFQVDSSLIGGVIIRTDKHVMDNSIKGKLARLRHSLNS